jgi:hypothetical protein
MARRRKLAFTSYAHPYRYQTAIRAADVDVVVTGRGDFRAELVPGITIG